MNSRILKLVVLWNVALSVVLLVSLAFNASWTQAANDPPVKIVTAHADTIGGDNAKGTSGLTINTNTGYVTLLSASVSLSTTSNSTCLVTASVGVNAAGNASTHNVGLSKDTTSSVETASNREIYFPNATGVNEVTSVYGFNNLTGSHTFYFLATGSPAMTASTRTMIIACFSKKL